MGATKIAISLPSEVLASLEEARRPAGISRSEFILRAIQDYLSANRAHAEADAYALGYKLMPETKEEIEAADRLGAQVLALTPWD